MSTDIKIINERVTKELANPQVFNTLVATTFKGLEKENIERAMVEGMIRGFTFEDFLEKNVYAVPFMDNNTKKQGYSLITSIDFARKKGMRSGVVGSSEPTYEFDKDGKLISCSVTIKRKVGKDIGDFTAKVYFCEYTTGKNLWTSKPRTMIAKVAEMHALRKACPEELSQMYTAEEMGDRVIEAQVVEKKPSTKAPQAPEKLEPIDIAGYEKKLLACKSLEDLKREWSAMPAEAKKNLEKVKDLVKVKLTPKA